YNLDDLSLDIPEAISTTERLILLANLCLAKEKVPYSQALGMALSLTELLDLSYQFNVDLTELDELVPLKQFAEHWQETVQFLDILHVHWPRILAERNKIDPMDRNIRLIKKLTEDIRNGKISNKIVLAGFTDLFPALSDLIAAVSENDNNLILKDNYITDKENPLPYYTDFHRSQEPVIIEALTHDKWEKKSFAPDSLDNVTFIEATNSADEATTIALLLREVLLTPNQTGALVTTDRNLARQVIIQMRRWNIELDDSAGTPLNHTAVGIYLSLLADVGLRPTGTNYLSLLKHPLAADGEMPDVFHKMVLEREKFLRSQKDARVWSMSLKTDFDKWTCLFVNNQIVSFKDLLKQHLLIAEELACSADKKGYDRLWQNDTGNQAHQLLMDLLDYADAIGKIESNSYPEVFKIFMQQVSIRPRYGMHPRLDILGPIEARFHHPDVCIIGGLNEKVFPPLPETGPWLNRAMREKLKLPSPEDKIETYAMDFAHAFCSPKVYLTRAIKSGNAQSIPSRFVERLKAVAQVNNIKFEIKTANLATLLDTPTTFDVSERPAPCPPLSDRPTKLPVTQIEIWRKSPYNIYARYILKLFPLMPLENQRVNALFGTLAHKATELFYKEHFDSTDKKVLLKIANDLFDQSAASDSDKKVMRLKFDSIADFLVNKKLEDLAVVKEKPLIEESGVAEFKVNGETFTLTAQADKIDVMKDGTVRIIDLKTYDPSSKKDVISGYTPQLPLEAVIMKEFGFGSLGPTAVSSLAYWRLSSKKNDSKTIEVINSVSEIDKLIDKTRAGLLNMVAAFQLPETRYEVCPISSEKLTFNDYEHLSRMAEWATGEEEE
ncbi:MAG: PD-(D/E)XK nuclease family protein, partial [Alphaproteobacteria bacterium]|nr:PD-(D/E)XK nuclease family protein [Alphaproteobacteria bacterium]